MFGLLLESQLWGCTGLAGKRGAMQHLKAKPSGSRPVMGINLRVQGLRDGICDFQREDKPLSINKQ